MPCRTTTPCARREHVQPGLAVRSEAVHQRHEAQALARGANNPIELALGTGLCNCGLTLFQDLIKCVPTMLQLPGVLFLDMQQAAQLASRNA